MPVHGRLTAYEFSGNTLLSRCETALMMAARRDDGGRVHQGVVRCNEGLGVPVNAVTKELLATA